MKRSPLRSPYLWALVAVVGVVVAAWVGRDRYEAAAVPPGSRAPDFTYPSLQHGDLSLSDYRGQVVLVNIWATWCNPCRVEMPTMQRLYEEMEGEDFEILAVSVDAASGTTDEYGRPGGDLAAFVEEYGLTFPILHDPSGAIQRRYQTTGVPESWVVDREGTVVKKWAGEQIWDSHENKELIRRLLDG